jgi:hypothetical protein
LDWTGVIGHEWLSGGIIDEMMRDLKERISEDPVLSSTTFVAPLFFQFYINKFGDYGTMPREIISGKPGCCFPSTTTRAIKM